MLQKKSKKWPKLQISQHQFWGSKTPNSPVVECWLDVKPPISKPHQGWIYFPKCHERLCLILRNLVILSRIKDLDVNYADYSKEGGVMRKFGNFQIWPNFDDGEVATEWLGKTIVVVNKDNGFETTQNWNDDHPEQFLPFSGRCQSHRDAGITSRGTNQ